MRKLILCFVAVLTLEGCSTRLGDFTILSNRNVEFQAEHSLVQRNVKGSDGIFWLFLFLPITEANLEDAVDKILAKHEADFLTNVVIHRKWWSLVVISWDGFVITADAWRNGSTPTSAIFTPDGIVRRGHNYEMIPLATGDAFQIIERK